MDVVSKTLNRFKRERNLVINHQRIRKIENSLEDKLNAPQGSPVLFFNASTRLSGLSQNAGFSLITSLAVRHLGIPVIHLVCRRGVSHCVLGTNRSQTQKAPPCAECIRTSKILFNPSIVEFLDYQEDISIKNAIDSLVLKDLILFKYQGFPVGQLILPSLRWILRRHNLFDDENTRYLAREYILSTWSLKCHFLEILKKHNPRAVVVFNGIFYPEAMLRWVAQQKGIPVYSHEVGMLPLSAFFTEKEATAYPVDVDANFQLTEEQEIHLNAFLEKRHQGKFVTAGVQFWPTIESLDSSFKQIFNKFDSVVPIFTNVVFDTSQSHANTVFEHMFTWLDLVLEIIKVYPKTLFVIRAHPDELRPGKGSQETVADWIKKNAVDQLDNVVFIPPDKYVSSYELIHQAKFVMVYNSTIGLEASIMGKAVLCAGKARYTQIPTVFFPKNQQEYRKTLKEFLNVEKIYHPDEYRQNARRVFYSQLFRASLPFDEFLENDGVWQGYVRLKKNKKDALSPKHSDVLRVILNGIIDHQPFIRDL